MIWAHLFGKVLKERDISPALHVRSLEGAEFLELSLLWILVKRFEQCLGEYEVLVVLFVIDLEVGEVRVDTKREVGGKCPWRSRPGKQRSFCIVD